MSYGPKERWLQIPLLVVIVAAVLLLADGAQGAVQDPNNIGCPAAPSGWANPAVSKSVLDPQSVPDARDPANGGELWAQGGNAASVSCTYHASTTKTVNVVVRYALPNDPNPFSDFDLGCGKGSLSWDSVDRVYRLASTKAWALATLSDTYGSLSSSEVPVFEGVTRQLLDNAQGYGHPCTLNATVTAVPSKIHFDIYVAGTNLKETFSASQTRKKNGAFSIEQISGLTVPLELKTKGVSRTLTIKLSAGIDYRAQTPRAAGQARFDVEVTASEIASCKKGATGTLTVSTKPAVRLHICGQTFLPGPAPRIRFYNQP